MWTDALLTILVAMTDGPTETPNLVPERFPFITFRQLFARHPDRLPHLKDQIRASIIDNQPQAFESLLGGITYTELFLDQLSAKEEADHVPEGEQMAGKFRASYEQVLFELDDAIGFFAKADAMTDEQKNNAIRLAAQTHSLALIAHFTMIQTLAGDQEFIDQVGQVDQAQVLGAISAFGGAFPRSLHTKEIAVAALVAHMLHTQSGISDEDRDHWLRDFYRHVVKDLDVYNPKTAEVYADSNREPRRMANALISLSKEGKIPEDWTYLSFGCGDGNRVDEEVFKIIKKEYPKALPGRIIGVDMMDQKEGAFYKKQTLDGTAIPIQFIKGTIEDLDSPQLRELIGKVDVIAGIGSPLNNQNLLRVHMWRYWPAIARLLKKGGIAMYEVGIPEPGGSANERMQRMLEFYRAFTGKNFGEIGVLPAYKRQEDKDSDTGAYIYPLEILRFIVERSGLKFVQSNEQVEQLLRTYKDPKRLYEDTLQDLNDNPLDNPFYWANPPESYDPEDLANVRALFIMEKVDEPKDLVSALLMPDRK